MAGVRLRARSRRDTTRCEVYFVVGILQYDLLDFSFPLWCNSAVLLLYYT